MKSREMGREWPAAEKLTPLVAAKDKKPQENCNSMCLKSFCDMNHFFFLGSIPVITLTCDTTFSRYFLIYIMHNIFSKSDCFHILKVVMYHVAGLLKVLPLFGTNLCLPRNSKVFMFLEFQVCVVYCTTHTWNSKTCTREWESCWSDHMFEKLNTFLTNRPERKEKAIFSSWTNEHNQFYQYFDQTRHNFCYFGIRSTQAN